MKKLSPTEADATSQQPLPVLKPATQIDFYARLQAVKERYLHNALKETIEEPTFDLRAVDGELASYAGATYLKRLASFHLRGETFFPVPYLLKRNPYLIGIREQGESAVAQHHTFLLSRSNSRRHRSRGNRVSPGTGFVDGR
jgi:hypothetical protein